MKLRQFFKRSYTIVGLRQDLINLYRLFKRQTSKKKVKNYLASHQVRKLQIGAGPIVLPGWLGTDVRSLSDQIVFLDATKPFLIDDGTFDYIHNEQMIEHITWYEGLKMLNECFRILKPGGKIRIATPDLKVIAGLYNSEKPLTEKYIRWTTDLYVYEAPDYKAGFVINNMFYFWNHKFMYDGELLELALKKAGFINVTRYTPGISDDENLLGIEMHGQIGNTTEEMNEFVTMVFEGTRP